MSQEQAVVYRDSVPAFNKLDNSLGEIVVIEALSGYGKTAFLQEAVRRRRTEDWLAEYIPITKGMRPADILATTVHKLSGNCNLHPQGLEDALVQLSYALPHRRYLAVLFDDVHSLHAETLTWVQTEFAPKLKDELFSISQGNCLLVFCGQRIPGSPADWPNHRRIYLLPFDRNTIQQFVDAVPSPELQGFLQSARNKKWLIEKMIRLCGGHPRALLQLLQEIEAGTWHPHPRRSVEYDRTIFEQHVETEINRLIGNLGDSYRTVLEGLSIFRSINSSTVRLVQQDQTVHNQENPLTVVRHLRNSNLLIAKEAVLDPVIRNGLTTRMMFNDRQRYLALNQMAEQAYQQWLLRFDPERPFEEARNYAAEAIYHCLCHSSQSQVLQACLRTVIQRLDQLLDTQDIHGCSSVQILTEHLAYDEDINTMLSDYELSIDQLVDQLVPELSNSLQLVSVSQLPAATSDYSSGIVAVLDGNQTVVGTGFLVWYQEQWLVVTCTHVLQKLNLQATSTVQLRHFRTEVGEFEATIVKFQPPDTPPLQWSAFEDVSILRPVQSLSGYNLAPHPLHTEPLHRDAYPSGEQSICFGYAQDRVNRGDYITGLAFDNEVALGFVALTNSEANGVRPGVSGAPWGHRDRQTIVGMVQSIVANGSRAYLIPANEILRVLASVFSS